MNIKGRCRGNGAHLANYLLNVIDNDRAEFLAMYGATSKDPRRALLEMSLTSELTSRTDKGLYHMQLSPRVEEAAEMTWEQKMRAVEITAGAMGLNGHKWALFEHEKEGRTHMHLVFERYDHDRGIMWDDEYNYDKHKAASRQMEKEFEWQLTHENKNFLDKDVKRFITDLYLESEDGAEFVKTMGKAGLEIVQGIDRRPYKIVDQYGKVHDLSRQLEGIRQGDVSDYLNSIRKDLRTETEVSRERRLENQRTFSEQSLSDKTHELSEAQELAAAMLNQQKQEVDKQGENEKPKEKFNYSYKINLTLENPPALPRQPEQKKQSEKIPDLSDNQAVAAEMLNRYRQRQTDQQERYRKQQEAQQQVTEQAKKQEQEKSLTDEAAEMLERYRRRQRDRDRDGPQI